MAISLKIDDTLQNRVHRIADQRHRSPHSIMVEAIQQFVAREEARAGFTQEALASWTGYQETGRHLTGQEVRDWLSTWGAMTKKPSPSATSNRHGRRRQRIGAVPAVSGRPGA